MDIEKLKAVGGSEWIRDEHHRIYFNLDVMVKMIELELGFYKTGNISSARLDGEQISNSKAKQILNSINGKFYYDVKSDGWKSTLPSAEWAKRIKWAILEKTGQEA